MGQLQSLLLSVANNWDKIDGSCGFTELSLEDFNISQVSLEQFDRLCTDECFEVGVGAAQACDASNEYLVDIKGQQLLFFVVGTILGHGQQGDHGQGDVVGGDQRQAMLRHLLQRNGADTQE